MEMNSIFEDWKFCIFMAIASIVFIICSGDIFGLVFFPFYYYLALKNFDKDKINGCVC